MPIHRRQKTRGMAFNCFHFYSVFRTAPGFHFASIPMKQLRYPIVAISLLALLFGCNKPDIPKESTYTFENQTGQRITFDVYDNKADYSVNANRLQRHILEPNAKEKITFDVARKYWIDWYGETYAINNWQSLRSSYNRSSPPPELSIAAENDAFVLKASVQDTTRSVLLGSDGISSTWETTLTGNPSINGIHRFIFRKDFFGEYIYTDMSGKITNTPFEYYVATTTGLGTQQSFTVYIVGTPATSIIFRITCNPGYLITPHTGRDTMLARFQQFSTLPEIPIIRQ
jgi:hypothetical protein